LRAASPDALCLDLLVFEAFAPDGEFDDEGCAMAVAAAARAHAAAVQSDNLMHDRKAEPQTTMSARVGALLERLEYMRQQMRTDSRSVVANSDARLHGPGISPHLLPHIFKPFQQG